MRVFEDSWALMDIRSRLFAWLNYFRCGWKRGLRNWSITVVVSLDYGGRMGMIMEIISQENIQRATLLDR